MSQLTKKALAHSLKKLMRKTPISKITVNDLVADCGVNRRTLYYHFQDIYDLLEWIYKTEIREVIADNRTLDTWNLAFLAIFDYLKTNEKIVFNTFHSIDRNSLETHLYNELYLLVHGILRDVFTNSNLSEDQIRNVAHFYKILFGGIVIDWIKNDMKEDPNKIILNLKQILTGNIRDALIDNLSMT